MSGTRRLLKKLSPDHLKASTDKKASSKKRKLTRPRTSKQYLALPAAQKDKYDDSVHVVSKMRSDKSISLTTVAKDYGLTRKEVLARAGSALRKNKSGRYVARPRDKLLRVLVIPGPQGQKEVAVKDSTVASKIAEYSDAVQKYLRTGDVAALKKFRRVKLLDEKGERIKLITDLAELQRLGSAGVLSFESLYARTA